MAETPAPTFKIIEQNGETGIRCLICTLVSFNPNDVREKYCGNCCVFHEDMARDLAHIEAQVEAGTLTREQGDMMRRLVGPHETGALAPGTVRHR